MNFFKNSTDSLYSFAKGKIDLVSLKDSILMPPPKRPSRSLHSNTSDDLTKHFFNDVLLYTSSENTIISTSSQGYSFKKHSFLQRKHSCVQDTAISDDSDDDFPKSKCKGSKKQLNLPKFKRLPCPSSLKQIEDFVMNLLDYFNSISIINATSITLKTKLITRHEDFHQNGLDKNYFIHSLMSMQNELIAMICLEKEGLIIDPN